MRAEPAAKPAGERHEPPTTSHGENTTSRAEAGYERVMSWDLWFIQLSGWPVFLAIVAVVFLFMIGLSVGLTWISNRTVVQSAAIAVAALAVLSLIMLGLAALLTRR